MITSVIGIVFMKEQKANKEIDIEEKRGLELLLRTGTDSIKTVSKNPLLKSFILSTLLSSFGFIAINSYTSKLIEISIDSSYIGLIISAASVVSILFTLVLSKLNLTKRSFFFLGLLGACALILIGIFNNPILLVALLIMQVAFLSVFEIGKQTRLNDLIETNRATTLSIFSLIGSISGVLGTVIFGYLADEFNIPFTFLIGGIAILFGVIFVPKGKDF
jgi:MFS family permease